MYTSLLLAALYAPGAEALVWETDYQAARKECARLEKPMAVFLGAGKDGPGKVVQGGINGDARQILGDRYVCVHIDTATAAGKRLAEQFEMPGGQGIVISDRTGRVQAFRHEGDLSAADLGSYLQRYSQPGYRVAITETATGGGTSFYAPPRDGTPGGKAGMGGPGGAVPGFYAYPVGGCGGCAGGCGGGCAGGSCGGGRGHGRRHR